MKFEIVCRYTGRVIFSGDFGSMKDCVEAAVAAYADLSVADLSVADLSGANLKNANLRNADLRNAKNADLVIACTRILPDGDLIGWKKCRDSALVKLRIPAEAKRCHAFGRKCRAEYADVIEIIGKDGPEQTARGVFGAGKLYVVGERVVPDSFDEDWTNECSHGIHFFITREEAEAY